LLNTNFNPTTFAKDNHVCTRINHCLRNNLHIGIGLIRDVVHSIKSNSTKLNDFRYPLLIFHGKKNASIPYKDIYRAVKQISSNDKTFKLIENGFIELYCDVEKEALGVIMIDWILKRVKKSPCLGQLQNMKLKTAPRRRSMVNLKNIVMLIVYLGCLR
jgi:Serine aminopeptidase, S33